MKRNKCHGHYFSYGTSGSVRINLPKSLMFQITLLKLKNEKASKNRGHKS